MAPEKRGRVVQRACDSCRSGKRKCDGLQPCAYCINAVRDCTYNIADKRRRRKPSEAPMPSPSPGPVLSTRSDSETSRARYSSELLPNLPPFASGSRATAAVAATANNESGSPSAAQDDATLMMLARAMDHEQLSPDAPHHAHHAASTPTASAQPSFVDQLHTHLKVTFALRSFPRSGHSAEEEEPLSNGDLGLLFLPTRQEAEHFVNCYFVQASATYRYLDRAQVERDLTHFYDHGAQKTEASVVVLLLLVMAVGCLWTPDADQSIKTQRAVQIYSAARRRLDRMQIFPPRLIIFQSYLLMVRLQLGLAHYQTAWLSFSRAARYAQLLGLHRASTESPSAEQLRRRCFWSAFQMDRHLSLVLGLPVIFNESDITQPFFEVPSLSSASGGDDDARALIGSLASVRLSRILGHALAELHTLRTMSPHERDACVQRLDMELVDWLRETPPFFHPRTEAGFETDGFVQIPEFFLRQRQNIHMGYHFIRLLIYRTYLLSSFLDYLPGTNRSPFTASDVIPDEVTRCVNAAVAIAELAASFRSSTSGVTFWHTSYYAFASLTVLCVYTMLYENAPDRARIEKVIDGAMHGHVRLAGSTTDERERIIQESRRMAAVLKERKEAQAGSTDPAPFTMDPAGAPVPLDGGVGLGSIPADWNTMWLDMQGMIQTGLDPANGVDFQSLVWPGQAL